MVENSLGKLALESTGINENLKDNWKYYIDSELDKNSVIRNFRTTVTDGKEYQVEYYNPDMIISVDYRVKSQQVHRKISSRV